MQVGLGGVVVHGMLTMGFAASCVNEHVRELADVDEISSRFLAPLKAGDVVTVLGSRARDGSSNSNAPSVTMADGKRLFAGSSEGATP